MTLLVGRGIRAFSARHWWPIPPTTSTNSAVPGSPSSSSGSSSGKTSSHDLFPIRCADIHMAKLRRITGRVAPHSNAGMVVLCETWKEV